jgi:hypothetical protein
MKSNYVVDSLRRQLTKYCVKVWGDNHLWIVKKPLLVYKKVIISKKQGLKTTVAILELPVGAEIVYNDEYTRGKMRASVAKVVGFTNKKITRAISGHDLNFKYIKNEIVQPTHEFDRSSSPCESGIHFFLTEVAARDWVPL